VATIFVDIPKVAPPAPPPAPPPPGGLRSGVPPRSELPSTTLVVPPVIPDQPPAPDPVSFALGCLVNCVDGGVDYGVPNGGVSDIVGGLGPKTPPPVVAPVRVSTGIDAPRKTHDVTPVYPLPALAIRLEGTVVLDCVISPQGRVVEVTVLEGHPLLAPAALEAARQWTYTPPRVNEIPVPVLLRASVTFQIRR
jgi:protein TonB